MARKGFAHPNISLGRRLPLRRWAWDGLAWAALLALLLWSFAPIAYILVSSFKLPLNIWEYPPTLHGPFTANNYLDVVSKWDAYTLHVRNSVIVTFGSSLATLAFALPAAFAFSRMGNRFLKVSALYLIAIRMVPPVVITIPLFPVFNDLGLLDKHITLILLYTAFEVSLAIWILKTFVDEVPVELDESAHIDGCTRLQAFVAITLPLCLPGVITVVIFTAVMAWNEYLFAFVFTSTSSRTAPVTLAEFIGAIMGVDWAALLAASIVHLTPMLVLTWLIQKHMIRGMKVGAIKA
jgi:multiple sugar transport system permease protein